MKCPYCNKAVKDMPNHLKKKLECSKKHGSKLLNDLKSVVYNKPLRFEND